MFGTCRVMCSFAGLVAFDLLQVDCGLMCCLQEHVCAYRQHIRTNTARIRMRPDNTPGQRRSIWPVLQNKMPLPLV